MSIERSGDDIRIHWSEDDDGYIATCPKFPGLSAFGITKDEARKEAEIARQLFMDWAEKVVECHTKLREMAEA